MHLAAAANELQDLVLDNLIRRRRNVDHLPARRHASAVCPIICSDPDQDALSYSAQGLPAGATIQTDPLYGHAYIVWTPTAGQIGAYDVSLRVADSGLPPVNEGHPVPDDFDAQPDIVVRDLRIVVRASNQAPEVLAVSATEGVPLSIDVLVRDIDFDAVNWAVDGMPSGMTMTPATSADGQTRLLALDARWTAWPMNSATSRTRPSANPTLR